MSRGYYIICGVIVAALVVGCEEGGGSSGGGGEDNTATTTNQGTKDDVDQNVFLPPPLLAAPPNEDTIVELYMATTHADNDANTPPPRVVLGQISEHASHVSDSSVGDDQRGASAHSMAVPEPLTVSLCFMSLGAIGAATRRRTA